MWGRLSRSRLPFALVLVVGAFAITTAEASTPPSGTVSPTSPQVSWTHKFVAPALVTPTGCDPQFCDIFTLAVELGEGAGDLTVTAAQDSLAAPGIEIVDASGTVVGEGSGLGTATAEVADVAAGTYKVQVTNGALLPAAAYRATATLTPKPKPVDPGGLPPDTVVYDHDETAPVVTADVPLRVVMVGFEPGSVDNARIFQQIPDQQQVGSLYTYDNDTRTGDNGLPVSTLINHGRSYYDENEPNLLPIQYKWHPELHYASTEFTQGLFDTMVANSTTGDYANPALRAYLETYNLTKGIFRVLASGDPAQLVAPLKPVRFVDGELTENWIADPDNAHLLPFPAGREPGDAGYTIFVLNTWDAPEASVFPKGEYHVFRINRVDPDRGDFDGIDWARIWGGRNRFMMVDLGAAPNAYESETWGNRARSLTGSALSDPPLWEYRANAPRLVDAVALVDGLDGIANAVPLGVWDEGVLQDVIARTVNEAVNGRFFHAYLYEPRPHTGRFYLSDNIWHDATTIYQSDLTKLYDQEAALKGLSTLTPYFKFEGDVAYEYLAEAANHPEYKADQAALDQAKQNGDDVAGVPYLSMNTATMMDYIDANKDRFLRGGPCATTVPTIQVVVPGHFAWALPIAAGIATNRAGVPWGFLNSVNDVTKWNGADKDQTLVLAHPNVLFNGTFTYTTIHEASHYLGLAHPHDMLGATRNADGSARYYDGFSWAYNTTASPTTYSHVETVYSILDQESIARGHTSYYLSWTGEALEEGGNAFFAQGLETVGALPLAAADARQDAVDNLALAQQLFKDFKFVDAALAAQAAWKAAAHYRDIALGLEPGTSQMQKGTQTGTDAQMAELGCNEPGVPAPAASVSAAPYHPGAAPLAGVAGVEVVPEHLPGTDDGHGHEGQVHEHAAAPAVEVAGELATHTHSHGGGTGPSDEPIGWAWPLAAMAMLVSVYASLGSYVTRLRPRRVRA